MTLTTRTCFVKEKSVLEAAVLARAGVTRRDVEPLLLIQC